MSGMQRFRPFLAAGFLFALAGTLSAESFGPFWHCGTNPPVTRATAVGPLAERVHDAASGGGYTAYVRPFFATARHPGTALEERSEWDALWPVAQSKTYAGEKSWRFLLAWDRERLDGTQSRFLVMPLWVHGHEQADSYAACFPLWGNVPHFLFSDRLEWCLWPLWMRRTVSDATTTSWLWPFFSRTDTPDGHLSKRRVFPFYLRHDRAGEFSKRSILWPFWTDVTYAYPSETGRAWILVPIAGHVETTKQNEWMAIPPFVRWGTSDKGSLVQVWPFYRRVTGWREETTFWPLFSERKDESGTRGYALWPLYFYRTTDLGRVQTTHYTFLPVFFQKNRFRLPAAAAKPAPFGAQKPAPAEAAAGNDASQRELVARRTAVWPLFTWEWDDETDESRFRTLDLWPGNDPAPVARSWAPLWTLFDRRRRGGHRESEALWGIYRASADEATGESAREIFPLWNRRTGKDDESFGWSIGKGLLAFDRFADGRKRFRFLWLGRWTWGGAPDAGSEGAE
jgi:hypothetical protein